MEVLMVFGATGRLMPPVMKDLDNYLSVKRHQEGTDGYQCSQKHDAQDFCPFAHDLMQ
jgi:hypothetical protein